MNRFADELAANANTVITENGGRNFALDNFDNCLVKALYSLANYRTDNDNKNDPVKYFDKALTDGELKCWAGKFALMVRDIMQGAGERSLGRALIARALDAGLLDVAATVNFLVNDRGGRWDDVIAIKQLVGNGFVDDKLTEAVKNQFKQDLVSYRAGNNVSLLGKWLPSINTSSAETRELGRQWAKIFGLSLAQYRKIVSKLRERIDVVERKITSNRWEQIEYPHVPSLAMARYGRVFRDHDHDRFEQYLIDVNAGKSKINTTGTTAPEIVQLVESDGKLAQTMWDNRKKFTFNGNVLPVCDVSGSMLTGIGKLSAMDVSIGLSLYLAEANQGPFHNKVIAFSHDSNIIDLSSYKTLDDKICAIKRDGGLDTNIENVLSNVLKLAVNSNCTQDEIPTIAFFTDMEFNPAADENANDYMFQMRSRGSYKTIFEKWREKYRQAGYQFPKMVFWNIAGRTGGVPVKANPLGLILVSGYNENLMKMVVTDAYDPWDALKETLSNPRYDI